MESLVEVSSGDHDIAVGISGFGSAKVGVERWRDLARLTGRTTYYLKYDAQELPWDINEPAPSVMDVYWEVMERWERAREGARIAAKHLSLWLKRWASSGKKILVVGFSLGAYTAWLAIQGLSDDLKGNVELVMLSAAIGDTVNRWSGLEKLSMVINGYSVRDSALKYAYPRAVEMDETPAAGLGPLIVSPLPNLLNVDMTDMIGWDHLWGSRNLSRLVGVALGCLWGSRSAPGMMCGALDLPSVVEPLSDDEVSRLLRWTIVDSSLWLMMSRAMDGDPVFVHRMRLLDLWSTSGGRFLSLLDAGLSVQTLQSTRLARSSAERGRFVLSGVLRHWISKTPKIS